MKHAFLVFLLLTGVVFAIEKKTESVENVLSGFQEFEVITFFSQYDEIDQNAIHDSVAASFQQFGKISVSENESMLSSLLQRSPSFPICYFSIAKKDDQIEVTLHVLAEAEVLANKYKTTCTIWKKTLSSQISQKDNQSNLVIGNLIQEMIKSLVEDCVKANNQDSKQLSFHIRKFKDLW